MKKAILFVSLIGIIVPVGFAQEWAKCSDFIGLDAYCSLSGYYIGTSNGLIKYSSTQNEWKRTGLAGRRVYALYHDFTATNDTLIAGTDQGIYISPDRGDNWVLTNAPQMTYHHIDIRKMYTYQRVLYACSANGVYYCDGDLTNWKLLGLQGQDISRYVGLASDTVAVFAGNQGLILTGEKYGTRNKTATKGITGVVDMVVYWSGNYTDSQLALLINDRNLYVTDKDSLYFSKTNNYTWETRWSAPEGVRINWIYLFSKGNLSIGTSKGVYTSTDRGVTMTKLEGIDNHMTSLDFPNEGSIGFNNFYYTTLGGGFYKTGSLIGYSNIQTLQPDPDGSMWVGTNGFGVYHTTDKGKNWVERNAGLNSLDVRDIEISSNGDMYLATRGGAYLSTDKGLNWQAVKPQNFPLHCILEAIPHDGITLFGSGKNTFQRLGSDFNWNGGVDNLSDEIYVIRYHPGMNRYLVAGKYGIWKSETAYVSWTKLSNFPSYAVYDLEIDPQGRILALTSGAVYYSDTNGTDWQTTAHVPKNYKQDLVVDSRGFYYVATDGGVYYSTDRGGSWTELNSGFPNLPYSALIDCISLDSENYLWAGSKTTGMYRTSTPVTAFTSLSETGYRNSMKAFFNSETGQIEMSWENKFDGKLHFSLFTPTGTCVESAECTLLPEQTSFKHSLPGLAAGIYLIRLQSAEGDMMTVKLLK